MSVTSAVFCHRPCEVDGCRKPALGVRGGHCHGPLSTDSRTPLCEAMRDYAPWTALTAD